ncbi:MAG: peptidoglycan DD-metalloendopeptidase family protein [Candidatus Limnocylindrales bacterium]
MRDARRAFARLPDPRHLAGSIAQAVAAVAAARTPDRRVQVSGRGIARQLRQFLRSPLLEISADRRGAPVLVVALVLLASLLALPPSSGTASAAAPDPTAAAARIAALAGGPAGSTQLTASGDGERGFQPYAPPADLNATTDGNTADQGTLGSFAADGTLLKPFSVADQLGGIDGQVQSYTVRAGDTLSKIAARFGLNVSSLFWANKLKNTDSLKVGQVLAIPPIDGVLYVVKEGDTIESIAATFHADIDKIVTYNGLSGDVVVIGETIMVPDGLGKALPASSFGPLGRCGSCSYAGPMTWPVDGWYFISQYFHPGHLAIDIAAHYGTPVVAAVSGRVVKTGWMGSGGYGIWISNGNGMYTVYYHLSYIGVGVGQYVSRGTRIGRVGASGNATGPHLHFEVWLGGYPYRGGYQVNPLNYF